MLDPEDIRSCLEQAGYDAELTASASRLTLTFDVGKRRIALVHDFPDVLLRTPVFWLASGYDGKLGHVGAERNGGLREVCIGDPGSTAINTDRPALVYRETVRQHVETLTHLIQDSEYNRVEQLREFDAHWEILCREEAGEINELFVVWNGQEPTGLQLRPPRASSSSNLLRRTAVALAEKLAAHRQSASVRGVAEWNLRQAVGKGLGVRLSGLEPAPASRDELLPWYFRAVRQANVASHHKLRRLRKKSRRDHWVVFSAPIPGGEAMFAVRWRSGAAGPLPASEEQAGAAGWTATPYRVRSMSRKSLVPRGGGSLDLSQNSVLLVGCGSVGSELALRLTSAGVGKLTVSDPEEFSEENLYRHVLSMRDLGRLKTLALAREIALKHPWTRVTPSNKPLQNLRDPEVLQPFDLVVIAIGSPTVERIFAEYCRQEALGVPVMNCWLEGYGIGGHAILALPRMKGCWHCAYVDPETLKRGLTSNLSFLKPGQVVMRRQGGCGTQFLPYNGIAASYTATMAANLAIRFLAGDVAYSAKASWKGDPAEARRARLKITRRYRHFGESLQVLPLHDRNCDLCGG